MGHTVFLQRDNMLFLGAIYFYSYIEYTNNSIWTGNKAELQNNHIWCEYIVCKVCFYQKKSCL